MRKLMLSFVVILTLFSARAESSGVYAPFYCIRPYPYQSSGEEDAARRYKQDVDGYVQKVKNYIFKAEREINDLKCDYPYLPMHKQREITDEISHIRDCIKRARLDTASVVGEYNLWIKKQQLYQQH